MMATSDIASALPRPVVQTSTSTTNQIQKSATAVAFHKSAQIITSSTTNSANVTASNLTMFALLGNQKTTLVQEIQMLLTPLSGALKIANAYAVQMVNAQKAPTGTPASAHAHAHHKNVKKSTIHGTLLPVSADAAISALMWKAFATAVVCIIEINSEVFSGSADFDDTFELAVKSVPVLAFRNGIGSWSTEAIAEFVRPVCAVVCA